MKRTNSASDAQVTPKSANHKSGRNGCAIGCALAFSALVSPALNADLIQTETLDANFLGDFVLDSSSGNIVINSVTVFGSAGQIATFTNALSVPGFLNFDNGLIMSSGTVAAINGPNVADGTGSDTLPAGVADGDAEFDTLTDAPQGTFDAAYIEIDFTPDGDTITGNFIFASEEYNEYAPPDGALSANNTFYDVMAFFINGVNYSVTAQGDDVSINSINKTLNAADYVDNDFGDFQPAVAPINIEADGFTKNLTWVAPVNQGESNTLKFGVADGGDSSFDSWLLIRQNSFRVFSAPTDVDLALSITDGGDEVVATTPLSISAIVENVGANVAEREITVDFTLPIGVTINNAQAASVLETGLNEDEWICLSSDTTPQTVACTSVTPLFNTPGNTQAQFGFDTDPVDASLIGNTLLIDAVLSTTDNDIDAVNNSISESTLVVISDTTAPSVVLSGMPAVTGAFTTIPVTFSFSENVTALSLTDIAVVNGSASNLTVVDAQQVTVDITPDGAGDISVSLAAGVVQDDAGNDNVPLETVTTIFNISSPVLSINNVPNNGIATAPFSVTLDFSEPVSDFILTDILIANGFGTELVVLDADSYELTITPDGTNNVTITIPDGAAQSVANGTDSSAASVSVTLNESAPFATISDIPAGGSVAGPYTLTITWSEEVVGMELTDISVNNATLSNLSPAVSTGTVFTVDVTPQAQGVVSVSILEATVTDSGGNDNPESLVATTLFDTVAPADPSASLLLAASSDTGSSSSDAITSLQEVVLSTAAGSAMEGNVATLFQQGVVVGTSVVQADGSVPFFVAGLVEGNNTLSYTLTDIAGNTSGQSPDLTIFVDTFAPEIAITQVPLASISNQAAYLVTGSCSAVGGAVTVGVTDAQPANISLPCDADGVWTTTFDLTLVVDGIDAVVVSATHSDIAGNNTSAVQVTANRDSTVPTLSITAIGVDDVLNANEFSMDVTISGATSDISDGQLVSVSLNGQSYSAPVSDDAWSVVVPAVDVQLFGLSEEIVADASTALGLPAAQATRTIAIDAQAPEAPGVNSILTNNVNPVITGVATLGAGEQLSVLVNGITYFNGDDNLSIDVEGNWTLIIPTVDMLDEGLIEVIATIVDAAGNSSSDASTQELEIDTSAPIVSINTPIAVDNLINLTEADAIVISGSSEPGGTLNLSIEDSVGQVVQASIAIDLLGLWTSDELDLSALQDGVLSISATASDNAGNLGVANPVMVQLLQQVPVITVSPVSGDNILNALDVTQDVLIQGTSTLLANADEVRLSVNAQEYVAIVASNSWQILVPAMDVQSWIDGEIISVDSSNEAGTPSETVMLALTIDAIFPSVSIDSTPLATASNVSNYPVSGVCSNDDLSVVVAIEGVEPESQSIVCSAAGSWLAFFDLTVVQDGLAVISVSATQSDAAGNVASALAVAANKDLSNPSISISAVTGDDLVNAAEAMSSVLLSGQTLEIQDDQLVSVLLNGKIYNAIVASGLWSVSVPFADTQLIVGSTSVTANVSTLAGLAAPEASRNFTVDLIAPDAPSVIDSISASNNPTLLGMATLEAGDQLSVSVGGNTYTLSAGDIIDVGDGSWSLSIPLSDALTDGVYDVQVTQTDASGNIVSVSGVSALTIDSTSPDTPLIALDLLASSDSGISSTDNVTNNTQPTFSVPAGSATPGDSVSLYTGPVLIGSTTVASDGGFLVFSSSALSDSLHAVSYRLSDPLGNISDVSPTLQILVDTQADPIIPTLPVMGDNIVNLAESLSVLIEGIAEPNTLLTITATDQLAASVTQQISVDGLGQWSNSDSLLDVSVLAQGDLQIDVVAVDVAGNSASSTPISITHDSSLPDAPIVNQLVTNSLTPTLTGVAVLDTSELLRVRVNGIQYVLDDGQLSIDSEGLWTLVIPENNMLSESIFDVLAQVVDTAQNLNSDTTTNELVVDTTAPEIALAQPENATSSTQNAYQVTGQCDAMDDDVIVSIENASAESQSVVCQSGGNWLAVFDVSSVADGIDVISVSIAQSDAAGNTSIAGPLFASKDTSVPSLSISLIAQDDVINAVELTADLFLSGLTNNVETGQVVTLVIDEMSYSATVDENSWALLIPQSAVDQFESLELITADVATLGGISTPQATRELHVDSQPPSLPSVMVLLTNQFAPQLSGVAVLGAGEQLLVTVNGVSYSVDSGDLVLTDDTWTLTLPIESALTDGVFDVMVSVTDTAGNVSSIPGVAALTIDTQLPDTPLSAPDLLASSDSGTSDIDNITQVASPDFSVPAGSVLGGAQVNLLADNVLVGTAAALPDGSFVISSSTLSDGDYAITYRAVDFAGNESDLSPVLNVNIDSVAQLAVINSPIMLDDVINAQEALAAILDGQGEPEAQVLLSFVDTDGNVVTANGSVDSLGEWSLAGMPVDLSTLVAGFLDITVETTDQAGNVSVSPSKFVDFYPIAPATPSVESLITNQVSPTIVGSVVADAGINLSVQVNEITYNLSNDALSLEGDGSWSLLIPDENALSEGVFEIVVTVIDAGGNVSTDQTFEELTIDLSAPARPSITPLISAASDIVLTGQATVEAGDTLSIIVNGRVYTVDDPALEVDEFGSWSLTLSGENALIDGIFEVVATVTDSAGNATSDNTSTELIVDRVSPVEPMVDPLLSASLTPVITGIAILGPFETLSVSLNGVSYESGTQLTIDFEGSWQLTVPPENSLFEGQFEVLATVIDAAGNIATDTSTLELVVDTTAPSVPTVKALVTSDSNPQLVGSVSLTDGDTLTLSIDEIIYELTGDALTLDSANSWRLQIPAQNALLEDVYDVEAIVTDAAGNVSIDTSSAELVIDTTLPAQPQVVTQVSSSSLPTIRGTALLDVGESLTVSVGGNSYITGGDDLFVDGTGAWRLTIPGPNALPDDSYEVVALVEDAAGNTASDSTTLELIVDSVVPSVPEVDTLITNDSTPIITGIALISAGERLLVTVNGIEYELTDSELSIDMSGNWSLDLSAITPLSDGGFSVAVSIVDQAGNTSSVPGIDVLTIDTELPEVPVVDVLLTNLDSPLLTGVAQLQSTDVLSVEVSGQTYTSDLAIIVNSDGTWSLNLVPQSVLADGVYDVIAVITDEAGNAASDTSVNELEIDRTSPVITLNVVAEDNILNFTDLQSALSVGGDSDAENGSSVVVGAATFTYTGTVSDGVWQVIIPSVDVQSFDASITLSVQVTDLAGNQSLSVSRQVLIDVGGPNLTIDDITTINANTQENILITGSCESTGSQVSVSVPGAEPVTQSVDCSEGRYTAIVDTSAIADGQGVVQITVAQDDESGNASNLTPLELSKDTRIPLLSISGVNDGGDNILNAAEAQAFSVFGDTFDAQPGDTVTLSLSDADASITVTTIVDADFEWLVDSLDASALNDGPLILEAFLVDAAGNASATVSQDLTLITTVPSLSASLDSPVWDSTPSVSGFSNQPDGSLVEVATDESMLLCTAVVSSGAWQCESLNPLANGSYTLIVSLTDALDNTVSEQLETLIDTLIDSDGDSLTDLIEGESDTDNDGLSDNLDLDSDGDGIADMLELLADPDGDNVPAYIDLDADGDTLPDALEGILDTDLDGFANFLDADSDNDGLGDAIEVGDVIANPRDSDADGIPDYLVTDSDADGTSDTLEGSGDTDGDGLPDYIDLDSDGDGIPDIVEGNEDLDADGATDRIDLDSDADGISDTVEAGPLPTAPVDTDNDGIADFRDLDSDADGISDTEEGNDDSDADGIANNIDDDSNGDGIPDVLAGAGDADGDGIADFLDGDIDGDNIGNSAEGLLDTDGDGIANYRDTDADGDTITDLLESDNDADGDGIANFLDTDSDGDELPDALEIGPVPLSPIDTDIDGIPDYLDDDSDGDGISDAVEGALDSDNDGLPSYLDLDSDNDGLSDALEGSMDTDNDGIGNYQDIDSDNDGLGDALETSDDTDADGLANYLDLDSDGDTIPDTDEGSGDFDGDALANFIDTDADGDSIADVIEVRLINDPGALVPTLIASDSDGDGSPDYLDTDSDGDSLADLVEVGPDAGNPVDTDSDGLPDYIDLDSDNDTLPDSEEGNDDSDGDGIPNVLDNDANNDGIPDNIAGSGDADNDGSPNFLDADIDGDGIANVIEGLLDTDGDGLANYLDLDSDADTINDAEEGSLDTDGDLLANFLDTDSDNDGLLDIDETSIDFDEDGQPNYLDTDSDDDGLSDSIETDADPDNDDRPNYLDDDSDNDGVHDSVEGALDSDADGLANFVDGDSDNDGIDDIVEAGPDPFLPLDSDNDLTADYLDSDSDNDGINDSIETSADTDGDGIPNYLDYDSDGDGIADSEELAMDTDSDGVADFLDSDTDGDGIPDAAEGSVDADGDGVPSYRDQDADGDGIADSIETDVDTDGDGAPDYLDNDSDADGINDSVEAGIDLLIPRDTDADGQPDYLDLDSDGDGLPDSEEGAIDSDGDGVPDLQDQDSNNDGIPDSLVGNEDQDFDGIPDKLDDDIDNDGVPNIIEGVVDTDGDGQYDFRDIDSDNDDIPDAQEGSSDTDADGVPNFQDLDSDGDGIADRAESTVDSDSDGIPDYVDTDSDGDGISDALEGVIDSDEDGIPNYLDLTSDVDGIPDALEGGVDTDGDGVINSADTDADGDGINDDVEAGADTSSPVDTDEDGIPDFLDVDSDNDGISDQIEGVEDSDGDGLVDSLDRDSNNDGIPDADIGNGDSDGDGVSDPLDNDIDGDGIDNLSEGQGDSDGDGVADFLDTDSDGDGVPDSVEGITDADGDGIVNYLDTDADNDGFPDLEEGIADTDGDGTPNFLDTDSDGDGIADAIETNNDPDGDGIPNYLDLDADGDNINDADEGVLDLDADNIPNYLDVDSDNDGVSDAQEGRSDSDGDNTPNFMDLDSDNDGIDDSVEGTGDADEDGLPNFLDSDSDGDGLSDRFEGSSDTDADGLADYLDLDADNDGIDDAIEGQGDFDIDGVPDYKDTDSDNDGIDDAIETITDTDQDGLPDYLDLDSDGDGKPDATEGNNDADNNGVPDFQEVNPTLDSDEDGLNDTLEGLGDTDGDGIPDYLDLDADNDGIADSFEGAADTDGDGILDFRDPDSDGDSLSDIIEGQVDSDNDSVPDYIDTDSDNDGIDDLVESDSDADGDGLRNALDLDSDADGLLDALEGELDSDGDGVRNAYDLDSDNDGLSDKFESIRRVIFLQATATIDNDALFSDPGDGLLSVAFDNDGDSIPDYRDLDSDNDSITDTIEADVTDIDQDGRVDNLIDNNGNGWHDLAESTTLNVPDIDNDGLPDFRDTDSDNDGLPDLFEVGGTDVDQDGRIDRFVDGNNDGLDDAVLAIPASLSDSDQDSIYDFRELDSDNDGVNDLVEIGGTDVDGDGRVDTLLDSDSDLIPDVVDVDSTGGSDADNDGIDDSADVDFVNGLDTDFDGIIDARDPDSNGDGLADASQFAQGAVIPDTDEDSVPDFQEPLKNGTVKTSLSGNGAGCSIADSPQSQRTDVILWLMLLVAIVNKLRARLRLVVNSVLMATLLSSCSLLSKGQQTSGLQSSKPVNEAPVIRHDPPVRRVYIGAGFGISMLAPDTEDTELKIANGNSSAGHLHLGMDISKRLSGELQAGTLGSTILEPRNLATVEDTATSVSYSAFAASALFYSGINRAAVSRRQGLMGYMRLGLGVLTSSGTGVEVEQLNSVQFLLGVGAEYGMRNGLALRAELLSYDADARALQMALLYRFGKAKSENKKSKSARQQSAHKTQIQTDARAKAIALNEEQATAAAVATKAEREKLISPRSTPRLTAPAPRLAGTDADNDGIADANDACADTEADIPIDDFGCAYFNGVARGVEFVHGTDRLTESAKKELARISTKLQNSPGLRVQISTHTDNTLSLADARNLTKKQGISVARFLVGKGILSNRLIVRAYGSSQPLGPDTSAAAQNQNRRVEILPVAAQ